jgi:hypothetical protein
MIHAITQCIKILIAEISHFLIHQSDLHFASGLVIFSGFRVIVVGNRACTSFFMTVLKE